jgi:hypothetical protein
MNSNENKITFRSIKIIILDIKKIYEITTQRETF